MVPSLCLGWLLAELYQIVKLAYQAHWQNSLLWVVSRVSKKSRIDATLDTINTFNHNTVHVCMYEFLVKYFRPDGMHYLPAAMRKN